MITNTDIYGASWKSAPTHHVEAAGTRFAYRRLGPDIGAPVVLLNHWGANLDNFDPPIVEGLAVDRPVYALDYRGIGASGGTAPLRVAEMASDTIGTIRALGLATPQTASTSTASIALSRDLKKRGWSFVGPATVYAFMQAMGLINDHTEECVARKRADDARTAFTRPV